MTNTNLFFNIGLEVPLLIMMIVLQIVCMLRYKRSSSNIKGLSGIIVANTGVLICQIADWILLLSVNNGTMTPFKLSLRWLFYIGEYWFGALMTFAIARYALAFIYYVSGKKKNYDIIAYIALACGLVLSVVMTSAYFTHWPYYINDLGHYIDNGSSLPLLALTHSITSLSSLYLFVKELKALGLRKALLFSLYILSTAISVTVDAALNSVFGYLISSFIILLLYFAIDLRESEKAYVKETELAKKEIEMTNLSVRLTMSQIQPHFLYNSLSTIAYLCSEDPKEAEIATNEFANYLRTNLKSLNSKDAIPFAKELDHVQNYLKVEQRRFSDQMNVVYDIMATDFLIPPLALQPIVENSVRHGVETRYELTTIKVSSIEKDDEYIVTVEDDGPGFDTKQELNDDRMHVGLASTKARLKEMVNGYMEIESEIGRGTKVSIHIPKEKK